MKHAIATGVAQRAPGVRRLGRAGYSSASIHKAAGMPVSAATGSRGGTRQRMRCPAHTLQSTALRSPAAPGGGPPRSTVSPWRTGLPCVARSARWRSTRPALPKDQRHPGPGCTRPVGHRHMSLRSLLGQAERQTARRWDSEISRLQRVRAMPLQEGLRPPGARKATEATEVCTTPQRLPGATRQAHDLIRPPSIRWRICRRSSPRTVSRRRWPPGGRGLGGSGCWTSAC